MTECHFNVKTLIRYLSLVAQNKNLTNFMAYFFKIRGSSTYKVR